MRMSQTYIGASFDGFAITLWTDRLENGRNWIVLEPMEFQNLQNFWQNQHQPLNP